MKPAGARASTPAPVVFEDGLGERCQIFDPTGNETLEMLCLRDELTAVSSFEFALRERVGRLANFHHAYYGHVRRVDRLNDPGAPLAIVSECPPGARLSEILAVAERRRLALDINAALCLIRQLVPAVAMLHQNARDVAHGALGPERIFVTPHARVVIVEYVMGSALEQLRFSHERYWEDFRIALPRSAGPPRFDHRADVTQIGIVALSLILGRPLREDEYPPRIGDVVGFAWAMSTLGDREPLAPALRAWLVRTLQLDPRKSFTSALEAQAALEEVLSDDSGYVAAPVALEAFLALCRTCADLPAEPAHTPMATPVSAPVPLVAVATAPPPVPVPPAYVRQVKPAQPFVAPAPWVEVSRPDASRMDAPPVLDPISLLVQPVAEPMNALPVVRPAPNVEPPRPPRPMRKDPEHDYDALAASRPLPAGAAPTSQMPAAVQDPPRRSRRRLVVAAVALIALAGGGIVAARRYASPAAIGAGLGTLIVETNPPGAQVLIDGEQRGMTPLNLTLKAGAHMLAVRGAGEPRVIPLTVPAGSQVSQYIELPKSGPVSGQLQVFSEPAGARVTVDGEPRGTAPITIGDLLPGAHEVVLESDVGSVKQTVKVEAGTSASLVVPLTTPAGAPLSGWVSVAAPVDVQLYEGERLIGTSQSDRIMVSAGRHEIEFVNETLGYRATRVVEVAPGRVAPVVIELPKGTIALNAVPWAEVWIDGEKVGETPIGNLSIPIGPHEISFRHPELGEERHAVTVTLTIPARLSVDLRKK